MPYNLRTRKGDKEKSDRSSSREVAAPVPKRARAPTKKEVGTQSRKSSEEIRKHDKIAALKNLLPASLHSNLSRYNINEVNDLSGQDVDLLWGRLRRDCDCRDESESDRLYGWLQLLGYIANTPVKSQKKTKMNSEAWMKKGNRKETKASAGMERPRSIRPKSSAKREITPSGASPKLNALISASVPDAVIEHKKEINKSDLLNTKEKLTEVPSGKNLALHHVIESSKMLREAKSHLHHEQNRAGTSKMTERTGMPESPRKTMPLEPTKKDRSSFSENRRESGIFGSGASDMRSPKSMMRGSSSTLSVPDERKRGREADKDSHLDEHKHGWDPVKRASYRDSVNWPSLLSPIKPWSAESHHDMMAGTHHSHPVAEKLSQSSKTTSQPTSLKSSGSAAMRM